MRVQIVCSFELPCQDERLALVDLNGGVQGFVLVLGKLLLTVCAMAAILHNANGWIACGTACRWHFVAVMQAILRFERVCKHPPCLLEL